MRRNQAVIGSIGGAMFASFLTTAQMYFSTPIASRSSFVFRLMVATGTSCVVCVCIWTYRYFGIDKALPEAKQNLATGGGDNSGSQYLAERDFHYHDHRGADLPSPTPTSPISADFKIPVLQIRSPRQVSLLNQSQRIELHDRGQPGMIVSIENPESEVGQQGIVAKGIVAIIRFMRPNGEVAGTSEYACWLDTYENRVTLEPGTSRALVIGIYSNPKVWHSFTNKRNDPVHRPRSLSQMQAVATNLSRALDPQYILLNPSITAQITLMSKYDGYTLAKKSFRLSTFESVTGETGGFTFEELP